MHMAGPVGLGFQVWVLVSFAGGGASRTPQGCSDSGFYTSRFSWPGAVVSHLPQFGPT